LGDFGEGKGKMVRFLLSAHVLCREEEEPNEDDDEEPNDPKPPLFPPSEALMANGLIF
jgi:hypothetical protein